MKTGKCIEDPDIFINEVNTLTAKDYENILIYINDPTIFSALSAKDRTALLKRFMNRFDWPNTIFSEEEAKRHQIDSDAILKILRCKLL